MKSYGNYGEILCKFKYFYGCIKYGFNKIVDIVFFDNLVIFFI